MDKHLCLHFDTGLGIPGDPEVPHVTNSINIAGSITGPRYPTGKSWG
jgi:hypothetical protein